MADSKSSSESLAAALHRTILGVLLAVVMLVTIGWGVGTMMTDQNPIGIISILMGIGSAYWIYSLFVEGLRER